MYKGFNIFYLIGASLGALSDGRVNITSICSTYAILAMTIAVRYCCVRKQFGPSADEEWPVIEYQAQVLFKYSILFGMLN